MMNESSVFKPLEFYLLLIGGIVCMGLAVAVLVDDIGVDNGEDLVEDLTAFIVEVVVGEGACVNAPRDVLVEVSLKLFLVDLIMGCVDAVTGPAVGCDDLVEDLSAFIVEVVVGEGACVNASGDVLVELSVKLVVVDLLLDAVDDGSTIAVDCDDLVVNLCLEVEINAAIVEVGGKVVDALVSTENQMK